MGLKSFYSSDEKIRLDIALTNNLNNFTRSFIKKLIEAGNVSVNNLIIRKPSLLIRTGALVSVEEPEIREDTLKPFDFPVDIIYEDNMLAVINKPAGISVHPSRGEREKTLVNALVGKISDLSGIGGVERPGIVHRLDKDTSGIMLIAKNDKSHNALAAQFKNRIIKKTYITFVYGVFKEAAGKIEGYIERDPKNKIKMKLSQTNGKHSLTSFRTIKTVDGVISLLEITPLTGRTHQIRVSMLETGHPILGDKIYKKIEFKNKNEFKRFSFVNRQMLHAYKISFIHPETGRLMTFTAGAPQDMLWGLQDTEYCAAADN